MKYTVVDVKLYCFLLLYKCVCTRIYTVEGQEGTREVGWEQSHIHSTHANKIHLCIITQALYIFIHNTYELFNFKIVNKFRMYKVTFTLDSVFHSFEACVGISYTAIVQHHLGLPNNRMEH